MFGILLARKAYALAKTAMVAQLAPERAELVSASGHLAENWHDRRWYRCDGGGILIATVGVEWLPVVAAACSSSTRCWPVGSHRAPIEPSCRERGHPGGTPLEVRRAVPAVATIRAAEGALTFLLALSIKRGGGDQWIFIAALLAAGVGTFVGTMVSSRLSRTFSTDGILVLTLLVPA